ncbi:MAG TPA: phosphoribosylpyrophosphate synthetase, partial [Armatimonadota bacterium]|nr:phosphoribosylpyrophosphate synthetase [Armatimonadota bacterium]
NNSPLEELVVTDTIPLKGDAAICKKITVLSVAPLLGEAMKRIYSHESVSELFLWNEK